MTKKILNYILVAIFGMLLGLIINMPSCKGPKVETVYIPVHDTVTIDSIRIEQKTNIVYKTRIDTFYITSKQDTVYLTNLPIEWKQYQDTIKTDSTSTEIKIDYHGFSSGIDNVSLSHHYYNKTEIVPEKKKNVSPFIMAEIGPSMNPTFTNYTGLTVGVGAGLYIKDSWGIGASLDLNMRGTGDDLSIKAQLYKKF